MGHKEIMNLVNRVAEQKVYDYISIAIANGVPKEKIIENLSSEYKRVYGESDEGKLSKKIDAYIESGGEETTEEWLPYKGKRQKRGIPIEYQGTVYTSVVAAAKKLGVKRSEVRREIKNGKGRYIRWTT